MMGSGCASPTLQQQQPQQQPLLPQQLLLLLPQPLLPQLSQQQLAAPQPATPSLACSPSRSTATCTRSAHMTVGSADPGVPLRPTLMATISRETMGIAPRPAR